jgi:hypothetical protein
VGIGKAGNIPIILKEQSVGALDRIGTINPTVDFDTVIYDYREISKDVGAISHFAATEVLGWLVFLARDNIYMTDGARVIPIADSIKDTIKDLGLNNITRREFTSAVVYPKRKQILISVFSADDSIYPDWQIKGDYEKFPQFRWTIDRPGTNSTTHPGRRAACLFQINDKTDNDIKIFFGSYEKNGKLYEDDNGTNDDNSGIYFYLEDAARNLGSSEHAKLFVGGSVLAQGSGTDYGVDLSVKYDFFDLASLVTSISLSQQLATFDDGIIFDTYIFPVLYPNRAKFGLHKKATFVQLILENDSADEPIDIYGWSVRGGMKGVSR